MTTLRPAVVHTDGTVGYWGKTYAIKKQAEGVFHVTLDGQYECEFRVMKGQPVMVTSGKSLSEKDTLEIAVAWLEAHPAP